MLRVLSRSSFDPVPTILGIKLWLIGSFPLCLVHSRTTKVHRQGTRRGQTTTKRATISRRHWSAWSSRHVSHPVPAWVVWYHQYFKNQLSRRSRATLLYLAIGRSITVSYLPIPSMAAYELLMSRTRLVKDLKFERLRTWMHGLSRNFNASMWVDVKVRGQPAFIFVPPTLLSLWISCRANFLRH